MAVIVDRVPPQAVHALHGFLLGGVVSLCLGALLSDVAYARSYQIQWSNFASWLIAGALVLTGLALLWAAIDLFRSERRGNRGLVYFVLLLGTWVLGFINALVHAKDAWAIMPTSLILSVIVAVFACVASWVGLATVRVGGAP